MSRVGNYTRGILIPKENFLQYLKRIIRESNANPFKGWGVWFTHTDRMRFFGKVKNLRKIEAVRAIKNIETK